MCRRLATLFDMILAANFLDLKPMLDVTCKAVAEMVKGKTPGDIKKVFDVEGEFTQEEKEQVLRDNYRTIENCTRKHSVASRCTSAVKTVACAGLSTAPLHPRALSLLSCSPSLCQARAATCSAEALSFVQR